MRLTALVEWGFSHVGQTFQELKDIKESFTAYYHHRHWRVYQRKELSLKQVLPLRIGLTSERSALFIFEDYQFKASQEGMFCYHFQLVPTCSSARSLGKTLLSGTLIRLAKAVSKLSIAILTSLLWAPAFIWLGCRERQPMVEGIRRGYSRGVDYASQLHAKERVHAFEEPKDSHVLASDIERIGRSLVGYRHVSSEAHAQENATRGIASGCSLNLSFCTSETGGEATFEGLDRRVATRENCQELIARYEAGITSFIRNSIFMDLGPEMTYGAILSSIERTRFMLVRTHWFRASDASSYAGLGRFAKESLDATEVWLLPRLRREEIALEKAKEDEQISTGQAREFVYYLAALYRRELLRYLREEFRAENFRQLEDCQDDRRSA